MHAEMHMVQLDPYEMDLDEATQCADTIRSSGEAFRGLQNNNNA